METVEVTVSKYPDRRELAIGCVHPSGNVEQFTITRISVEELKGIMRAKSEDVQKILERFI